MFIGRAGLIRQRDAACIAINRDLQFRLDNFVGDLEVDIIRCSHPARRDDRAYRKPRRERWPCRRESSRRGSFASSVDTSVSVTDAVPSDAFGAVAKIDAESCQSHPASR